MLITDLTALVGGAGELLHGFEVGLAAAVPVAALAALARTLGVLAAALLRVFVQAHPVRYLKRKLLVELVFAIRTYRAGSKRWL